MAGAIEPPGPAAARPWPGGSSRAGLALARWLRGLPPLALASGLAAVGASAQAALPGPAGNAAPWGSAPVLGAALAVAGLAWAAWAAWMLRTASGPDGRPAALVDEGPFRFGRHPQALGLTAALAGAALATGAPFLALPPLAFALLMDRLVLPREEALLRQRFGGWYSDYATDVRRWL